MNAKQQALYAYIQAFELDNSEDELSFSERQLAKENGWPLLYARKAIENTKNFCS